MSLNKTPIEWCDYTWNPITGCLNNCPYCFARKIATRFKGTKAFPNGFEPTFHPDRLLDPYKLNKSLKKIFVCSMGELFNPNIPPIWIRLTLNIIGYCAHCTFITLTKCPDYMAMWKDEIPPYCWLGVSIDGKEEKAHQQSMVYNLLCCVSWVKFICFEPLLAPINIDLNGINWIIIGAQTNPYKPPQKEWVENLIVKAHSQNIPIFLKDNLRWHTKIQEFPE